MKWGWKNQLLLQNQLVPQKCYQGLRNGFCCCQAGYSPGRDQSESQHVVSRDNTHSKNTVLQVKNEKKMLWN